MTRIFIILLSLLHLYYYQYCCSYYYGDRYQYYCHYKYYLYHYLIILHCTNVDKITDRPLPICQQKIVKCDSQSPSLTPLATICYHMLPYAALYSPMLLSATLCYPMLSSAPLCPSLLPFDILCYPMPPYTTLCHPLLSSDQENWLHQRPKQPKHQTSEVSTLLRRQVAATLRGKGMACCESLWYAQCSPPCLRSSSWKPSSLPRREPASSFW